jgi:hypothetical protein
MFFMTPAARSLVRYILALLACCLVSWLGVAALVTLGIIWPHNPVPWILLAVWGVLISVVLAIPGASFRDEPVQLIVFFAFLPFGAAAMFIWPRLPPAVQDLLQGRFRIRQQARRQRRQAK